MPFVFFVFWWWLWLHYALRITLRVCRQLTFGNDDKINALVNVIVIEHANKRPIEADTLNANSTGDKNNGDSSCGHRPNPPIIDLILKNSWYTVNELRASHALRAQSIKASKRLYNPYARSSSSSIIRSSNKVKTSDFAATTPATTTKALIDKPHTRTHS